MSFKLNKHTFQSLQDLVDKIAKILRRDSRGYCRWRDLEKWFRKLGITYVASGVFRDVYLVPGKKYVIKLAKYDTDENKREFSLYRHTRKRIRRLLARPVAISKKGDVVLSEYLPLKVNHKECKRLKSLLPLEYRWDLKSQNIRATKKGFAKLVDFH